MPDSNRIKIENYLRSKYARKIEFGTDIVPYGFCDTTLNAGSGFTDYLWSTGDTTSSITVNKTGTYWVRAYDVFGYETGDTVSVTFPVKNLNFQDTTICSGDTLHVKPLTSDLSHYAILWSDSSTDTVLHITQPGSYYVRITDSLGCYVYSDTIAVSVNNFPADATLGNDTAFCAGNTIVLVHPGYTVSSYLWTGGFAGSNLAVTTTGNYWVLATDIQGCMVRDTIHVDVTGTAPLAMFSSDSVCLSDTTHFTDLSTATFPDNIVSWQWSFGDSMSSVLQNPSHLYQAAGTYNVSLTATVASGCTGVHGFPVIVYSLPQALFASVPITCANTLNQFSDMSLYPQGDSLIGWAWDFGDTQYSNIQHPVHFYADSGSYSITMTVQTDKGCSDTSMASIHVKSPLSPAPGNFSLLTPEHNAIVADTMVYFSWEPSYGVQRYVLQLAEDSGFSVNVTTYDSIYITSYSASIGSTPKYWRVLAYNICNALTYSGERKISYFAPPSILGLKLWLKADTVIKNGFNISTWPDCSGNMNDASQPTIVSQPYYNSSLSALNDQPALHFDGTDDMLQGVTIPGLDTSSISIFVVAQGDDQSYILAGFFEISSYTNGFSFGRRAFYGETNLSLYNNGAYIFAPSGSIPTTGFPFKILEGIKDFNVSSKLFINSISQGTSVDMTLNGPFTNTFYKIGYSQGLSYFKGDIAEIILYNIALPDSNRIKIENYLRSKYAPPVNIGPDISITHGLCLTTLDAGGRFTHFLWSTGDTTQTLALNQSGTYAVTVTDIFGFLSSDTIQVNMPTFYEIQDTGLCLGDTLGFSFNLGNDYTYLWLPDSITTGTFTITQPGTYSLTVFDTLGCQRTQSFTVAADSFPVQASLGPDRNICQGDNISLQNGAQQAVSYHWSDNSGNSYLPINGAPGTTPAYSVTVTNANGCLAMDTILLNINGVMPAVAFSHDSVCEGSATHFTDLSSVTPPYSIASRLWDFGDSTTSTVQNPVHVYPDGGIYHVSLTLVTDSGCTRTFQKNVKVFSQPDVNFLPYGGCSGVAISFADNTSCPYGNLTGWHWDFGDTYGTGNDTSVLQNPVYTYDSSGTYLVKLIAASAAGCMDSTEHTIIIKQSPGVDFSNTTACASQVVYFTDQSIIQPWETITDFEWQFGDGTVSSVSNPSHLFDTAGIYHVTLTIKTLSGCEVSRTKDVVIGAIPEASFGYMNNCIYSTSHFTDSSTSAQGSINYWDWNFSNLGTSSLQNPGFVFPDTGIYVVSLMVKTDHDCADSVSASIRIYPLPTAAFDLDPEYGIPPLPVSFTNLSTGASSFLWAFGDGDTATGSDPVHTFETQGIFDILLTAYSGLGCSDTVSHKAYVLPTTVDISVLNTSTSLNGNILNVATNLMNVGSRKIEHIDVAMQLENGNIIHEHWHGSMMQGEVVHYIFNAQPEIPAGQNVRFVCVTASLLPELVEDDLSNNRDCPVLEGSFTLSEPYPNPVVTNLVIAYILPFGGNVTIEIFNDMGERVKELFNGERQEGYNAQTFDLSALNGGVYAFKITFHDTALRKKFVKM